MGEKPGNLATPRIASYVDRVHARWLRISSEVELRVNRMSSLAVVRALVKRLMPADADDAEPRKIKPQRWKLPKIRNFPDDDDDDPERV